MYIYKNFEEYLQLNYFDIIRDSLLEYIKLNELSQFIDGFGIKTYDEFSIDSIKVVGVRFTKNKIDSVEFKIIFVSEYSVYDSVYNQDSIFPRIIEMKDCFEFRLHGSFRKGFKPKKSEEIVKSDENEERITNGLVPIISSDEMDTYATKFLKEFCPEALEKPMKLNVNRILEEKGITIRFAPLEDNIFGKTFFANDKAIVYKNGKDSLYNYLFDEIEEIDVSPGTILINFDKMLERPDGVYRNTIIHEAVHWFFHRNYFELRQLLNNEITCSSCYKRELHEYENSDIAWMEWQARSMAPKILMPKKMALIKWEEITKEVEEYAKEKDITSIQKWTKAVDKFANFFGVSIASAKIRLSELGKSKVDGIRGYVDGSKIEPFIYKNNSLKKNQTFIISIDQLGSLLSTSPFINEALRTEKLLYINKMLVVNNPKYIDIKKFKLTQYALEHADECCLIFNVERYGINSEGSYTKNCYLLSSTSNRKEEKSVVQEQRIKVMSNAYDGGTHFDLHRNEYPSDFGGTLREHFQHAKRKKQLNSVEDLEFESDVSKKTIYNYFNNETSPDRIMILKLALSLRLSSSYILDLLGKADCLPTKNDAINNLFYTIIYAYQRMGLEYVYRDLMKTGKQFILNMSDGWLYNHGLN
mgnify:CR=1 FL=1